MKRSELVFDHCYVDLPDYEFEQLNRLLNRTKTVVPQVVQSQNDSWEGLYLYARNESYLEVLKNRKKAALGFCLSPPPGHEETNSDPRPDLKMVWAVRKVLRPNGDPWFTRYSPENMSPEIDSWIMTYQRTRLSRTHFIDPFATRLASIRLRMNEQLVKRCVANLNWLPREPEQGDGIVSIRIPQRDAAEDFVIQLALTKEDVMPQLLGFTLDCNMRNEVPFEERLSDGAFTLIRSGSIVTVERK